MDVRQPFAVIVTTNETDLMGAVVVAAQVRGASAIVDTPLAHSQPKRQLRRAFASEPRFVVVLDGKQAEIINVRTGKHATSTADDAATALVTFFGNERARYDRMIADRIITFDRNPSMPLPVQRALPKAA